jgi:hypothetical protein
MKHITPPHEVRDSEKLASIVESFRLGRPVPPVACQGPTALTGSHRIAAYEAAYESWDAGEEGWEDSPEPALETVEVSDEDYIAACKLIGHDPYEDIKEFSLFAAALHEATEDGNLKSALADQMTDYEDFTAADFARYA